MVGVVVARSLLIPAGEENVDISKALMLDC